MASKLICLGGLIPFLCHSPRSLTRKLGGGQFFWGMMQNLPTLKPTFLQMNLVIFTPPMRQWPQSNTGDTETTGRDCSGRAMGAGEVAQWVKELAAVKPEDLSSIPQRDTVEGGNQLLQGDNHTCTMAQCSSPKYTRE